MIVFLDLQHPDSANSCSCRLGVELFAQCIEISKRLGPFMTK